jgi:membrane fusion protein PltH
VSLSLDHSKENVSMKKNLIRIAFAAVVIAAAVGVTFVLNQPAQARQSPPQPRALVQPNRLAPTAAKAIGTFISANQASLAFTLAGRIKEIKVKEGDAIKSGAPMISLDTSALDFQVAQAQAALDAALVNLDKVKSGPTPEDVAIAKSKLDLARAAVNQAQAGYDKIGGNSNPAIAITAQALTLEQATATFQGALAVYQQTINHPTATELRTAQAQVAQAQAALDLAKQNVINARMMAPFDGVVLWIGPHVGETVSPAVPILTIADLSKMQIQLGVDENTLGSLSVGLSASITTDSLQGKTLTGHISKMGLLATTTASIVTIPVTIDLDPSDALVYPGLSATVEIQSPK